MDAMMTEELIEHELIQGSPEWLEFRMSHDGASEAAAMLGLSKKTSRTELLRMKSSGITKEFSAWVQENILDYGHEVEALARPIVEKQIGSKLYPVVLSRGRTSASCDGLRMSGEKGWEHKQWNETLAAAVSAKELPDEFMAQPQQCLMVSGAESWIFTVSDGTEDRMVSMDILPDPVWFERIRAGWEQFNKDRENYQHVEIIEKPAADAILSLPALFVHAKGEITDDNMAEFGKALAASLATVRSTSLVTDQDFSNAEAAAKLYRETGKKLMLAKEAMLEQTLTIGAAARMIDAWHEDLRITALKLEKDVEKEKEAKKLAILNGAKTAYSEHIAALEAGIKPIRLNIQQPDFAGAMKGKRLVSAWMDAVDTALANGKIAADATAKDILAKLTWCKETSAGFGFLFNDLAQIISKPMDDFQLVVTSRIDAHKAAEAAKLEAEREVMRIEEEAKAKAKIEAEAAARAKSEAEVIAKADEEERAKAAVEAAAKLKAEQDAKPAPATRPVTTWPFPTPAATAEKGVVVEAPALGDVLHAVVPAHIAQAIAPTHPTRAELLDAIASTFGTTNEVALDWVLQEFRADIKFAEAAA